MVDVIPPQTDTYGTALDIFDRTHPLRVDADENLKVAGTFTPTGVLDVLNLGQLVPKIYDFISCSPSGNNPTTVIYKTGGASGTTVATLTITYNGDNELLTVTRT